MKSDDLKAVTEEVMHRANMERARQGLRPYHLSHKDPIWIVIEGFAVLVTQAQNDLNKQVEVLSDRYTQTVAHKLSDLLQNNKSKTNDLLSEIAQQKIDPQINTEKLYQTQLAIITELKKWKQQEAEKSNKDSHSILKIGVAIIVILQLVLLVKSF